MPLTAVGPGGIRQFSEPRFFEALTIAQVQQIPVPVDKAHAVVAASALGVTYIYKFFGASVLPVDGTIVLRPNDSTPGRWHLIATGGGSGLGFNYVVNAFGDMQALPASPLNASCIIRGLATRGDGQGGIYTWWNDSISADDAITVAKPNSIVAATPGRWIKLL